MSEVTQNNETLPKSTEHINYSWGTVSVGVKSPDGTEKSFQKPFVKIDFVGTLGVIKYLESLDEKSAEKAVSAFAYGLNLKTQAPIRQQILAEQAGPEKSFEKLVNSIIKSREANGKPVTEAKAREIAKMMLD